MKQLRPIKPPKHEVRYDPPWRKGERDARYIVLPAPKLVQKWWEYTDPIKTWRAYVRIRLKYIFIVRDYIFAMLIRFIVIGFGIYLYVFHVGPVVIPAIQKTLTSLFQIFF